MTRSLRLSSGSIGERSPLLGSTYEQYSKSSDEITGRQRHVTQTSVVSIRMGKHINLLHAIGMMVGSIAGTGIFISPTGVTEKVGSVGSTLVVWTLTGLFNLLLALCYAELGTALPLAGGDYAYIDYALGRLPAFLCLWLMVVLIGPCVIALSARTVAAYLTALLGLECQVTLALLVSFIVIGVAAVINCSSVKWSVRFITIFSLGKVLAMTVIIITGIVRVAQGYTAYLDRPFEGSVTSPGPLIVSFLPAFVTFAGWECVCALAEEMKNPQRDLPIATVVSVLLVVAVYLLMNVAYFTALSPTEFVASDAVATLFAERTMPEVSFLIPLFVIVSAIGSALNLFLCCPRWAFAGGRDQAMPRVLAFVHIKSFIPIPSIILTLAVTAFFCAAIFFDIQDMLNITSIITQIKMILALLALLVLKYREPDKSSTITIPCFLVVFSLAVLTVVTVIPLWESPFVAATAFVVFMCGFPLYYIKEHMSKYNCTNNFMDTVTCFIQRLLLVLPPSSNKGA